MTIQSTFVCRDEFGDGTRKRFLVLITCANCRRSFDGIQVKILEI